MTTVDLDRLFTIAENSLLLDQVEGELRHLGHEAEAGLLVKIQQDVGVQIDREMGGVSAGISDGSQPAPGLASAELNADFQPVTMGRLSVFMQMHEKFPAGELKENLAAFMQTLDLKDTAPTMGQSPEKPHI